MKIIDLDDITLWPRDIIRFVVEHAEKLTDSYENRETVAGLSLSERLGENAQRHPLLCEARRFVWATVRDSDLLGFHATRLIDFEDVRRDGLLCATPSMLLRRARENLRPEFAERLNSAAPHIEDRQEACRSYTGKIWAVPQRERLHDVGMKEFFNSYGGEALQNFLHGLDFPDLVNEFRRISRPAVVAFHFPIAEWCDETQDSLPDSMIKLVLKQFRSSNISLLDWDIRISRPIPAKNIVEVSSVDLPY